MRPSALLAAQLVLAVHGALVHVRTPARAQTRPAALRASAACAAAPSVGKLYDVPVSNNGARCRMLLYYYGVKESEVAIVPPTELGGLRSDEYLALHPQGKMPLLVLPSGESIPESDTIARFLCATFASRAPTISPTDPLEAARVDALCRHHDMHLASVQSAMYKAAAPAGPQFPPFGAFADRTAGLDEITHQLAVTNTYASDDGPYLLGSSPTAADCALFPTVIFAMIMLPKFNRDPKAAMGPRLCAWYDHMKSNDDVGKKVYAEVAGALEGWTSKGRWDTIRGAGLTDAEDATIFDKILGGEIPAEIVYEDDKCLAFRDIAPVAPTHVLLIPKVRNGLTRLKLADAEHKGILGHMLAVGVPAVVAAEGLTDYRLVVNDGESACQSVFHLHMHVIGGKPLTWPPGV